MKPAIKYGAAAIAAVALIAIVMLLVTHPGAAADNYRLCVSGDGIAACQTLAATSGITISCVNVRDRVECLEKILAREADFTPVDPEDMYVAANMPGQNFRIVKEIRSKDDPTEEHRYEAVAVVHNSLSLGNIRELQGRNSCHTGVGRTVGYKIPVTKLSQLGVLGPLDDPELTPRENELRALSRAFSKACIVGKWAPDVETDRRLKSSYSSLCALCENPGRCDYPDQFSGYDGALRCLAQNGDVAWTKVAVVRDFFGLVEGKSPQADPQQYSYLCPDASKKPVSGPPCSWAGRPWLAYLTHADLANVDGLRRQISLAENSGPPDSLPLVLGLTDKLTAVDREPIPPQDFLSKSRYNDVIEREVGSRSVRIRMCVVGAAALKKCQALSTVAYSRDVRPQIDCVRTAGQGECMAALTKDEADVVTLDAEDAYTASRRFNMHAIMSENATGSEASYAAVALVKKASNFKALSDLQGTRSCHPAFGDLTGWKVPLASLLQKGLLPGQLCPLGRALADFFSAGSCVPGALASQDNPVVLCSKCASGVQGSSACSASPAEGFYGEEGAFKCLSTGSGDVAFVKASTALKLADGDYELLCPDGGTATVADFARCNLAVVPTRTVMTSNYRSEARVEGMRMAFLDISNWFTKRRDVLDIFATFEGQDDVIFKNSARSLTVLDPELTEQRRFDALIDQFVATCPNQGI